jgi:hypothetical protein
MVTCIFPLENTLLEVPSDFEKEISSISFFASAR